MLPIGTSRLPIESNLKEQDEPSARVNVIDTSPQKRNLAERTSTAVETEPVKSADTSSVAPKSIRAKHDQHDRSDPEPISAEERLADALLARMAKVVDPTFDVDWQSQAKPTRAASTKHTTADIGDIGGIDEPKALMIPVSTNDSGQPEKAVP